MARVMDTIQRTGPTVDESAIPAGTGLNTYTDSGITYVRAPKVTAVSISDTSDGPTRTIPVPEENEPDLPKLKRLTEIAQAAERRKQLAEVHEGWRK
jgi:hypothetical protein